MGPFDVTQLSLFLAALLIALPALMMALAPLLPAAVCRWANVGLGALCTLVNIGNVVGDSWVYHLFCGVLEKVLTVSIVILAYRRFGPGASEA